MSAVDTPSEIMIIAYTHSPLPLALMSPTNCIECDIQIIFMCHCLYEIIVFLCQRGQKKGKVDGKRTKSIALCILPKECTERDMANIFTCEAHTKLLYFYVGGLWFTPKRDGRQQKRDAR